MNKVVNFLKISLLKWAVQGTTMLNIKAEHLLSFSELYLFYGHFKVTISVLLQCNPQLWYTISPEYKVRLRPQLSLCTFLREPPIQKFWNFVYTFLGWISEKFNFLRTLWAENCQKMSAILDFWHFSGVFSP